MNGNVLLGFEKRVQKCAFFQRLHIRSTEICNRNTMRHKTVMQNRNIKTEPLKAPFYNILNI
jgi:hypothetical protein